MEWGAEHKTERLEALNALLWGLGTGLRQVGKHEDLSSIPCTHKKNPSTVTCTCNPRTKEEKTGGSLGFTGQSACPVAGLRPTRGLVSKGKNSSKRKHSWFDL